MSGEICQRGRKPRKQKWHAERWVERLQQKFEKKGVEEPAQKSGVDRLRTRPRGWGDLGKKITNGTEL